MNRYAVTVRFAIQAGRMDEFLPQVARQAKESLREDGCLDFQVWTDSDKPDEVFLWEVYTCPEAFRTHLDTAHFKQFDGSVRGLVAQKAVEAWALQVPAAGGSKRRRRTEGQASDDSL